MSAREMPVLQQATPPLPWPAQAGDNRGWTAAEVERARHGDVLAVQSQVVEQHPLPNVGGGDESWNIDKCANGQKCEHKNCMFYHSDNERRCRKWCLFNQPCDFYREGGGRCIGGLHVKVHDVNQTFQVDLENTPEALHLLRKLERESPDARARYVRITVSGFAMVRRKLLGKFLDLMPLLHELVLPDRINNDHLLLFLTDVVEGCARSNPRLQKVVFEDGSEENLWNT